MNRLRERIFLMHNMYNIIIYFVLSSLCHLMLLVLLWKKKKYLSECYNAPDSTINI